MKLSSIISVFNSKQFITGCLKNLVQQTIYKKGEMEILVIDSGSQEGEHHIIFEFQKKYPNIKYLKTRNRESLYKAWNRGIHMSKGNFITNSNTDDRHESKCLETLVQYLENNRNIDLVYGNLFKSTILNETFNDNDHSHPCTSQTFFPSSLLLHNYIGAQPVWRKKIHQKIGLFNESYKILGDYEFLLRAVNRGCNFKHIPEAEGIMLWHKNALSTCDQTGIVEKAKVLSNYRNPNVIKSIYKHVLDCDINEIQNEALLDLGIRSLCYFPQFFNSSPQFDFKFAQQCFEQNHNHKALAFNLSSLLEIVNSGNSSTAENSKNKLFFFYGSTEELPPEYELKGSVPIYLHRCKNEKIGGQFRQKFAFDLKKFHEFLFRHIPVESLSRNVEILIWGFNERGKLLGNYLSSTGFDKVRYIDSSLEITSDQFNDSKQKIISFNNVKKVDGVVFILAMSSHHWESVTQRIVQNFKTAMILKIDHS